VPCVWNGSAPLSRPQRIWCQWVSDRVGPPNPGFGHRLWSGRGGTPTHLIRLFFVCDACRNHITRQPRFVIFFLIYCCPPENGGCGVVAVIRQRTWTNGRDRNHLRSLQSLLMQLCALETHIRISRKLKKFVDLMRNHWSGPEPSPCPLSGRCKLPKNLRKSQ